MPGTLFKSGRMSMQYVTKKTGLPLIFVPAKDGTHSRLVLEDPLLIEELTAELQFMSGIIYIDENERVSSTEQEVQAAYKRAVIEEYLASQQLNPVASVSDSGPVIAASTATLAAVGAAVTSQAAIAASTPAPKTK